MRLKKLIINGFKSFAQRTEIVFNDGITGIVGPNGSGKSNIGDAVRWVLGEQSAKTLRGASMSDVIFNGTQKRKPMAYCEVSLVFVNDDHQLPVDYAEVMVTRRVYRTGDSEYFINQSACRLKDVIDLFRDTGIGREGYSIIGQGRIDEILSRKSEDRRQVFEEAAGIMKHKARKEEAEKKLEHTLDNAARLDDIMEELGSRLGPLEKQSKAAREYIALTGELKTLDLNLFLIRSDRAKERLAELDNELLRLQAAADDAARIMEEKVAARDQTQENIADLDTKLTGARDSLMTCADAVHEAQNLLTAICSRRDTRHENRVRMENEQHEADDRLRELAQKLETLAADMESHKTLLKQAEESAAEAEQERIRTEAQREAAELALQEHKTQVLTAMDRRSAVRNDQTRLTTMRQQMESRMAELQGTLETMHAEEEKLSCEAREAEATLTTEQERRGVLGRELTALQDRFRVQDAKLLEERRQFDAWTAALQSDESLLKARTVMTREMEGYNNSVRRAVQYAKQQGMTSVRGVLSQLISVPREYETAIDMALGAATQNIVTDDEETAKRLINYLRENRFGRATFLPISTVRGKTLNNTERGCLRMRGCIGVASELVACDPAYKGIVESLLGRTVIAEDLDAGIPIMRAGNHSFRLVTLQGDVMHSGGSMTGGSVQSHGTGFFSRERELKELTEKVARERTALEQQKEKMLQAQDEKEQIRTEGNAKRQAFHQQEIAVAREQAHSDNNRARLQAHRAAIAENENAVVQLREQLEELALRLQEISRQDTDDLEQDTLAARTEVLQQRVAAARVSAAEAADSEMVRKLQLSDLRHESDSLIRDHSRAGLDLEQLRGERQRREQQLQEMDALDAEDMRRQQEAETLQAERRAEQEKQEQVIRSLQERRHREQDGLKELLADIENLHLSQTRDAEHIHRVEMNRSRVENDLKVQQDRIWNTYEATYADAEAFRTTPFNVPQAEKQAAVLNGRIRALGSVNVGAVEEYAATKARYDDLTLQLDDLRKAEAELRQLIDRLLKEMEKTFVDNFTRIQGYFSETFTKLFGGGHATLSLQDPSDPLNCGIEVNAQPPGKKLQLLSLLSGGERALTAIAILFAMLKLKPTPFCILDEIEAALDDANIGYYADYLKSFSKKTQFIVVTHRKGTMERCNSLYGVSMEEQGVSKMASVSLKEYHE